MKTYKDNGYIYFYDTHIRFWTIYKCDDKGNQSSEDVEYFNDRKQLVNTYDFLKFTAI